MKSKRVGELIKEYINMKNENEKFKELIAKIEKMKKSGEIDLSTEEDLSLAVMNLISLEEHFFFTGVKTGKNDYMDLLFQVREVRKSLLKKLIDKHEGETWCISKHLLGTTMRLIEVGTKLYADGKKDEAKEIFGKAHEIYSLFWALRLKLIDTAGLKTAVAKEQPWTMKDIMDKLVDCCDE
ncbi:MAG: hypothetical protein UT16_C0031G0009 [Candidatus Azambacteria bacterium GW2011_GWA2_39_10]|uniref:Uncharacterized protein n=1 Tax=Candidatus Azambacteria bacterium GW2011_GWA2_39_10 TaxID=1618611 RepID=A0A0G0LFW2_9BACT|nr:MAG: hypothetical protein UT16_C0031G0009 [Candidatus Azambacteria bacterium GW2011_GWA2_39_10]